MTHRQLEKTYEPTQVEDRWYQYWLQQRYGHSSSSHPGTPYSIVIPPPNVTGSLHIGHAFNNSLQDILIRWRRMQGRNTLWMPGMDHAGIATQNVVERQLKEEGLTRDDLGRTQFIERVWKWKEESGGTIIQQLKRLGASCDWDRLRFTMDEGLSDAVREVFVRLYEEGLIYRGERLINWCPRCLTALSDIEVEHEDAKGLLYHIAYPLQEDPTIRLTVATTRPETLLGDTAVAVHPEDDRYAHLIGKTIALPLTERTIPIVADDILVDREFGTGAVKITPAHDFNDFEAGERHNLSRFMLLDRHGLFDAQGLQKAKVETALQNDLPGLTPQQARARVEQRLKDREYLQKTEDHAMALGKCYRCKTIVEPYLSPQWFVKIQPLASPAIQAVEDGRVRIVPETWKNNYLGWMREIKDWCISRQIWWGHQIPAWYCLPCNKKAGAVLDSPASSKLVFSPDAVPIVTRHTPTACPDCHSTDLVRDEDVLDTWFSSALWPFSTLGWPKDTAELQTYYPTTTLVTGLDILFFWVARMIMMGLKFMGDVPFRDVYIHALVRDAEGQKMSKSKGNVIDPLQVMSQYGTDALRFTLASMASPGRDIKLAEERVEGYRNFANKIWNVARFIHMHLQSSSRELPVPDRTFADRWVLSRLNQCITAINTSLEAYRFDQASSALYQFIWHEYCDWYLELIKPILQKDSSEAESTRYTLRHTFETILRLLHPFMPFISEEIWQSLPHEGESIMIEPYPSGSASWESREVEQEFTLLNHCVTTIRMGRSLLSIPPGQSIPLYGTSLDDQEVKTLTQLHSSIEHLGKGSLTLSSIEHWPKPQTLTFSIEQLTIGLLVEGHVDLQKALTRITKQQQDGNKEVTRIQGKLNNPNFTNKAPQEVVEEHTTRVNTLQHELSMLRQSQQQLEAIAQEQTG